MTSDELEMSSCKSKFKIGERVGLKSGGPWMTVEMWRDDDIVMAMWFDGAELKRDAFHPFMLTL